MKCQFVNVYATYRNFNRQCSSSREKIEMKKTFRACLFHTVRGQLGDLESVSPASWHAVIRNFYPPHKKRAEVSFPRRGIEESFLIVLTLNISELILDLTAPNLSKKCASQYVSREVTSGAWLAFRKNIGTRGRNRCALYSYPSCSCLTMALFCFILFYLVLFFSFIFPFLMTLAKDFREVNSLRQILLGWSDHIELTCHLFICLFY